jgi:hypothetical protein
MRPKRQRVSVRAHAGRDTTLDMVRWPENLIPMKAESHDHLQKERDEIRKSCAT